MPDTAPGGYDWSRAMARTPAGLAVSAVVVSYRTGPALFDCLNALLADGDVSEIVLVDNGNPPETQERLGEMARRSAKLKVIGDGINRGFGAGVNFGVKAAAGERLLVINPDAILRPGSIAWLEKARSIGGEPMIVGGRIFGEDGREQRGARRRRLTMRSAAATFLGLGVLNKVDPGFVNINLNDQPQPSGPVPMNAVSGALMYISRSGFERLHGFDEGYFLHVEDLDLCRRAEQDGGTVIYTPFASALHIGATSDAPSAFVERHKAKGLARYFRKFAKTRREKLAAEVIGPTMGVALVLRSMVRGR